MRFDVTCGSCRAELEAEVVLEPAEAVESGGDPVRDEAAEDVAVHCPRCGALLELELPPGTEEVEIRPRA
jgi:transcription elongation factor Elf1